MPDATVPDAAGPDAAGPGATGPDAEPGQPQPTRAATAQELGRELTLARLAAGLTVRQLAGKADVPRGTVQGYLSGDHLPPPGYLEPFQRILAVCGQNGSPEQLALWVEALARARRAPGRRAAATPSPYRGLAAFGEGDAEWFHGRTELTGLIVDRIQRQAEGRYSPLVVVGPSGAGKSSLLRAGVLPAVKARGWAPVVLAPGAHPYRSYTAAIQSYPAAVQDAASGSDRPLVLIVDQFEEVFAREVTEDERQRFITAVCTARAGTAAVVLGIRADFYPQALRHPLLAQAIQQDQIVVGPMNAEELREAVTGPARRAKLDVDAALVALVLRELVPRTSGTASAAAHDPGALPLLSHALQAAWERHRGGRLTVADYLAGGGIAHSIAQSADTVYEELSEQRRQTARLLFRRLVRTSGDTADTRRTVTLAEILGGAGEEARARDLQDVLDRFTTARLLTVDADTVQLTHEALLTAWPRLQEWIEADRTGLRLHRYLSDAARTWHDADQDPGSLLRGARLEAVRDWAGDLADEAELNRTERAFLDASVRSDQQERQATRRRTQLLTRLLCVTVVLLLFTAASTSFALVQRTQAQHQQRIAEDVRDTAVSRQVAGSADQLRGSDPALADQLALAAYRVQPTPESRSVLLGMTATPAVTRFRTSLGTMAAAVAPVGDLLATGDNTGSVRLWTVAPSSTSSDTSSGTTSGASSGTSSGAPTSLGSSFRALPGSVFATAISPDAHLLAVGGAAGTVTLWQIGDPAHPRLAARLPLAGPAAYGVAFSPDSTTLAVATAGHGIALLDVTDPARSRPLPPLPADPSGDVHALAFSADGRLFAAGLPDGAVRVWHADHPDRMTVDGADLAGSGTTINAVAIAAGTDDIAAAGADHSVYLWRVDHAPGWSPRPTVLHGFTSFANTVAFSPDGRTIAAGGADGTARVWRLGDLGQLQDLGHPAPVTGVLFLPNGSLLTAAADGYARIWALPGGVSHDATNPVFTVAFGRDGTMEANAESTATASGEVDLWSPSSGQETRQPGQPGQTLATVASPTGPGRFSGASALSHAGTLLAIGASDGGTTLWDLSRPGSPQRVGPVLRGPTLQLEALAFSPDDHLLAVAGDDHHVWIWNVARPAAPTLLAHLDQPGNLVFNLAFSPSGRYLAAACADGRLYLWNLAQPSSPVLASATKVSATYAYAVSFSPKGDTIAVGSADKTVRLLDISTPTRPAPAGPPLTGPTNYVYSVAFSPDGSRLAAGSSDGSAWLWSLAVGSPPQRFATLKASAPIFTVAFSPDGSLLAAGTSDNTVWRWHVTVAAAAATVCRSGTDAVTPAEWQEYLPETPYRGPCGG